MPWPWSRGMLVKRASGLSGFFNKCKSFQAGVSGETLCWLYAPETESAQRINSVKYCRRSAHVPSSQGQDGFDRCLPRRVKEAQDREGIKQFSRARGNLQPSFGTPEPCSFDPEIQVPDRRCETQRLPTHRASDAAAWCRVLPSTSPQQSVPFLTLSEA